MTESSGGNQILIDKLTEIIVANLSNEHFGARELAQEYGLTRSRLNRRLLAASKKTIHQFIRETRLMKALEILRNEDVTVAEVAFRTGFSTPAYFNTCFHELYGISPGKVKKGEKEVRNGTITIQEVAGVKQKKPARRTLILTISGIAFIGIIVLQFIYPGHLISFRRNNLENLIASGGRISVAVMPFQNMTNDTLWNVWQTGIQDIMITTLSDSPDELATRQTATINNLVKNSGLSGYASVTLPLARTISRKLDANVLIYGSIKQAGTTVRLDAQLINTITGEIIKSFSSEGPGNGIQLSKSLSSDIKNFLVISGLKEKASDFQRTVTSNSPEAYRYFILGQKAFGDRDFAAAIKLFSQAATIDTSFTYAILYNALACLYSNRFEEGVKWCLRAYNRREMMPVYQATYTNYVYSQFFETPFESIKYLKQILEIDDQVPYIWYQLSERYGFLEQYDNAIPASIKSFELYNKTGIKPNLSSEYVLLGALYHETGQFRNEKKLYRKGARDFPANAAIIRRQAILALTEGDTVKANDYLLKYNSIRKENSASDVDLKMNLANTYWFAGMLDKAENYFRETLSMEPESPRHMNNLGWFLIDTDRNVDEGLKINEKALEMFPDNFYYLDCKGWGLFKQGKYDEALKILEKAYESDHDPANRYIVYLHLEEVKKAITARNKHEQYIPSLKIRTVTQFGMWI